MTNVLKVLTFIIAALIISACGDLFKGDNTGMLPQAGASPGLVSLGKRKFYFTEKERVEYLGEKATLLAQYGMTGLYVGEYTYGGADKYLTIESFPMEGELGAAGVYYYFYGKKLFARGREVDVGVQGVLDSEHNNRSLYFYKGRWFFSVVYTGKDPVPDLIPLGRSIAAEVPGKNWKPTGFRYLEVEGVTWRHAHVTWGNTLSMDFLPPSVEAFAPGAGADAKIYALNFFGRKDADGAADDLNRMLMYEKSYENRKLQMDGFTLRVRKADFDKFGTVCCVAYRNNIFIITHPDSLDKAEVIFRRVVDKARSTPAR